MIEVKGWTITNCLNCDEKFRHHTNKKRQYCSLKCQQGKIRKEIFKKIENGSYNLPSPGGNGRHNRRKRYAEGKSH